MKLKICTLLIASAFALTCSNIQAEEETPLPTEIKSMRDYEILEKAAFAGNYQAQRNLAYTLSTGIPFNPILGCAWRIVIVKSGSLSVDQSDTVNKKYYCEKLTPDDIEAAVAQSKTIMAQMAEK